MSSKGKKIYSNKNKQLIEALDSLNTPIAKVPKETIHAYAMYHRSVCVLLYNKQQKLYLQQRSFDKEFYPGFWDISATGHVYAGEARIDAAHRQLKHSLAISCNKLYLQHEFSPHPQTDNEFISIFSTGPCNLIPNPIKGEIEQGIFVEKHELDYLIQYYSNILTPNLINFWKYGCLFQPNR